MPILNYTTQIEANKTVAEIQKCLSSHGAKAILNEYENGYIKALSFQIDLNGNAVGFKLPCAWEPILIILENNKKVPRRLCTQEQALRVAWRIVKDWIEAQMALLETKMVKMEQIFLPYAMTRDGKTFYEKVAENPQFLLSSPNPQN